MSPGWISAIVAVSVLAGGMGGALWRGGRRDGKIDAVLEQLGEIVADHEERIRVMERIRGPRHSGRA